MAERDLSKLSNVDLLHELYVRDDILDQEMNLDTFRQNQVHLWTQYAEFLREKAGTINGAFVSIVNDFSGQTGNFHDISIRISGDSRCYSIINYAFLDEKVLQYIIKQKAGDRNFIEIAVASLYAEFESVFSKNLSELQFLSIGLLKYWVRTDRVENIIEDIYKIKKEARRVKKEIDDDYIRSHAAHEAAIRKLQESKKLEETDGLWSASFSELKQKYEASFGLFVGMGFLFLLFYFVAFLCKWIDINNIHNHWQLLSYAAISFVWLWGMRMLAKFTYRYQTLKEDARARKAYIQTYLMLTEKAGGEIDVGARAIVLHSIFRALPGADQTEDISAPSLTDIISAMKSK